MPKDQELRVLHTRAKRRAGYLQKNPAKILNHDRYWSSLIAQQVFETSEQLRLTEPDTAWQRLQWLPQAIERCSAVSGHLVHIPSRVRSVSDLSTSYRLWIEGLAAWGTGLNRLAERRLARARQTLLAVNNLRAAAWIGVELAELRAGEDQRQRALAVLTATRDLVEQLDDQPAAAALTRISHQPSASRLDPEALWDARQLLVQRLPIEDLSAYPLGSAISPLPSPAASGLDAAIGQGPSPQVVERTEKPKLDESQVASPHQPLNPTQPLALIVSELNDGADPASALFTAGARQELLTLLVNRG